MTAREMIEGLINKLEGSVAELTQEIRARRDEIQTLGADRDAANAALVELKALIGQ